ncbi:hypothetical protein KIN20_027190 [Parelaphostrongylus tenuis]|uniref:Uncharacterized protein n=1 Tax=Parelaphostrongylus tenuis TaxID=148309 RepID=A0AAD5QZ40_PARTN|nr:hypothetical protein KIN20_027190 [Parelaphostrongylus tenuis]
MVHAHSVIRNRLDEFLEEAARKNITFMASGHLENSARLDIFLNEASEKNFPLHFTPMDRALRGYGAFVLWMHLVVYLILKHIHRDVIYSPEEERSLREYVSSNVSAVTSRSISPRKGSEGVKEHVTSKKTTSRACSEAIKESKDSKEKGSRSKHGVSRKVKKESKIKGSHAKIDVSKKVKKGSKEKMSRKHDVGMKSKKTSKEKGSHEKNDVSKKSKKISKQKKL